MGSFEFLKRALGDVTVLLGNSVSVVRLACYAAKLYGCCSGQAGWNAAGSKLSSTRMTLRLFDDIPMIRHTYNYGLGQHESSTAAALLGLVANAVDQVFLPVEKALWLHEVGVIKFRDETADRLDLLSTALWAASLYISLLQTLRSLRAHWWRRSCLRDTSAGASPPRHVHAALALDAALAAKLALDLTHAVSCLPRGVLWGDRVGATAVAALATTSSVVGIALYFARRRLLK